MLLLDAVPLLEADTVCFSTVNNCYIVVTVYCRKCAVANSCN